MAAETCRGERCSRGLAWRAWAFAVALSLSPAAGVVAGAGDVTLAERLTLLREAYPDHIAAVDEAHVRMKDGAEIPIDDKRAKTHEAKLADADIEDMLSQIYPVTGCRPADGRMARDFDPGRIRNERFFAAIYGASEKAVRGKLVTVSWFGQKLSVAGTIGVDRKLAAVAADLAGVAPEVRSYLTPSGGAFNWRPIAGTSRLSTHSYGIAIDISTAKSDYWRWAKAPPGGGLGEPKHKIPEEIIAAFERHGFIWGGAWYHFDTMHFEYRPELVAIGQLAKSRGCVR